MDGTLIFSIMKYLGETQKKPKTSLRPTIFMKTNFENTKAWPNVVGFYTLVEN